MAEVIEMIQLSPTMEEGMLVAWLKNEGDAVETGEPIAEVETDKATMEMESFDGGTLGKIYIQEGGKVPLGTALGVLVEEGEEPPEAPAAAAAPTPAAVEDAPAEERAAADTAVAAEPAPAAALMTSGGRVKATPLARKIAEKKGIDLSQVAGTGPGGRISLSRQFPW